MRTAQGSSRLRSCFRCAAIRAAVTRQKAAPMLSAVAAAVLVSMMALMLLGGLLKKAARAVDGQWKRLARLRSRLGEESEEDAGYRHLTARMYDQTLAEILGSTESISCHRPPRA